MQVQVKDCLTTMDPVVHDQPVPATGQPFLGGQLLRRQDHVPDQLLIPGVKIVDRSNMTVRNDEDVGGGKRVDVAESRHQIIAVK